MSCDHEQWATADSHAEQGRKQRYHVFDTRLKVCGSECREQLIPLYHYPASTGCPFPAAALKSNSAQKHGLHTYINPSFYLSFWTQI